MKKVLIISSGSLSFKYKLFSFPDEKIIISGMADRVGVENAVFKIKLSNGREYVKNISIHDQGEAVKPLIKDLRKFHVVEDLREITGIGHRIVNNGGVFRESVRAGDEELREMLDLGGLAPLHNIPGANGVKAFMNIVPNVPQVAVFNTSYRQTLGPIHYLYSIPYEYYEDYGIRRYGAHGISISYVAPRAAKMLRRNPNLVNLIVCHLGSGALITAIKRGKFYDTSMGISPLTGVTMGTRNGDFDPSALQRLMHKTRINIDEAIGVLNYESGLLGISDVSSDMRDLIESKDKRAKLARKIFINHVVHYVDVYVAELGRTDAVVFTTRVGERDPGTRAGIMSSLRYLGLEPDLKANRTDGKKFISKPKSRVRATIAPTGEGLMITREVVRVVR